MLTASIILVSCSSKSTAINESIETTNPVEESTPTKAPIEEPLPVNTIIDALLGRHKILTVTADEVIVITDLGVTQKVIMNRSAVSISITDTIAFYKVTIKDNTGLSADMTLTESDYNKVMSWIYKN
jgi:hypothetical protein